MPGPFVPAISPDGHVYVSTAWGRVGRDNTSLLRGVVYALEGKTGKVLWKFELKGHFTGQPVIGDGDVIYAKSSTTKKVYALNRKNGKVIWTHDAGIDAGLTIGTDGSVLFLMDDQIISVNKLGGKNWSFKGGSSRIAVGPNGEIYLETLIYYLRWMSRQVPKNGSMKPREKFTWPAVGSDGSIYVI